MKKRFRRIAIIISVITAVTAVAVGFSFWHNHEMNTAKQSQEALMAQRIQDIQNAENSEKSSLRDKIANLENQVKTLLVEEVVVFDAAPIEEEILRIGEFATEAYSHTTIGTLDTVEYFKHLGWKIPGSQKTALVEMDGVIKVGIDVTKINIDTNEVTKTITVQIPEAMILSNELFEDTMIVHMEEEGIFSDITLEDSSALHAQIKEKAQQKVLSSNLFEQAQTEAGQYVRGLIEAVPQVKDTYTIVVR